MIRLIRLAVALVLIHMAAAAADDPAWLGSWQETTNADDFMVIERDRCGFKDPGAEPQFGCAAHGPAGDIWIRVGGNRVHLKVRLDGDLLVLGGDGKGTYRRLAAVPPEMQLVPMPIPAAKAVSAERIAAVATEAASRFKEDQAVRTDRSRAGDAGKVDAGNTAWLKTIIAEAGWPDAARFGKPTAKAMFLFVQHSGDLPLMLGALPCIEADVHAGSGDPQSYALLFDRVQIYSGRPQRYGSQIVDDKGKQVVYLLENKAKVEQLRAGLGMFPLKTYLQVFEQQTGAKVGFMEQVRFDD